MKKIYPGTSIPIQKLIPQPLLPKEKGIKSWLKSLSQTGRGVKACGIPEKGEGGLGKLHIA
jgi:hypothetical protein